MLKFNKSDKNSCNIWYLFVELENRTKNKSKFDPYFES